MSFNLIICVLLLQCQLLLMTGNWQNSERIITAAYNEDHPDPAIGSQNLFYIKRNTDNNLVVYDANLQADKRMNPHNPVKVYWIRNTEGGVIKELTFIQKKMAYGLDLKKVANAYEGTIAAYDKRVIRIMYAANGKPTAYVMINGKWQQLEHIYLHIADIKALIPKITYIQLFGKDIKTGADVSEKIMI